MTAILDRSNSHADLYMSFTDLEPWQRPQHCTKANEHIDVDMVFVDFEPRPWRQVVIEI